MPATRYYSADDVRALPDDGKRYETVHGELLVTLAPGFPHQQILARLFRVLDRYLVSHELEQLYWSPAELSFGLDETLVQPDLFVADFGPTTRSSRWSDLRELHLVVEVVSPSSGRSDRFAKRRLYQEQGIPEYWIVDIEQELVEVWTPGAHFPRIARERLTWRHPALDADCVVELRRLFGVE